METKGCLSLDTIRDRKVVGWEENKENLLASSDGTCFFANLGTSGQEEWQVYDYKYF